MANDIKSHFTSDGHPIHGRATLDERITYTQNNLLGTCKYFNGIAQHTCVAGIRYWSVGPQPCIKEYDTGKHVCPLRQFPTDDEAHGAAVTRENGLDKALAQWDSRHLNHECVECGTPYERLRQRGPCVYADPCGHRQYQGRLPKEGTPHGKQGL